MKVKKVTKKTLDKAVPVYDLTVPYLENFVLANGAVVHNSKDVADAVCGAYQTLLTRAATWISSFDDDRYNSNMDRRADASEMERYGEERQD